MKHLYLFTLEIAPLQPGKVYDELPSHLTLMSRFRSDLSPRELSDVVAPLFDRVDALQLVFAETTQLGPKKLTVHTVEHSTALKQLHNELHQLLDSLHVAYLYPQYNGSGHKPHVTHREGAQFLPGDIHMAQAAYLIEVIDKQRVIGCKFKLGQHPK